MELGIKEIKVYEDLILIISQVLGRWKTKDEKLLPYDEYLEILASQFNDVSFYYLPGTKN